MSRAQRSGLWALTAVVSAGLASGCSTLRPDPCETWPRAVDIGVGATFALLGTGTAVVAVQSDDTGGVGELERLGPVTGTLAFGLLGGLFVGSALASTTRSCPVPPAASGLPSAQVPD